IRAVAAVGIEHVTRIEEQHRAKRALILDEGNREDQLGPTGDLHVTAERQGILIRVALVGCALRAQGAALEATHRTDTAGIVMLEERYPVRGAEATQNAAVGMQTQGPVPGDGEEALTAIADLVEVH